MGELPNKKVLVVPNFFLNDLRKLNPYLGNLLLNNRFETNYVEFTKGANIKFPRFGGAFQRRFYLCFCEGQII